VDCFGPERLEEYRGKGRLDMCLVYGADPTMLSPAPGGRDNAVMVSKATFHAFALPHAGGDYFLRPDRIMGAFLLPAATPPAARAPPLVCAQEMAQDSRTKERLDAAHRAASARGASLRTQHLERVARRAERIKEMAETAPPWDLAAHEHADGAGDVEMAQAVALTKMPTADGQSAHVPSAGHASFHTPKHAPSRWGHPGVDDTAGPSARVEGAGEM
jgi:hypothetical protein